MTVEYTYFIHYEQHNAVLRELTICHAVFYRHTKLKMINETNNVWVQVDAHAISCSSSWKLMHNPMGYLRTLLISVVNIATIYRNFNNSVGILVHSLESYSAQNLHCFFRQSSVISTMGTKCSLYGTIQTVTLILDFETSYVCNIHRVHLPWPCLIYFRTTFTRRTRGHGLGTFKTVNFTFPASDKRHFSI